MSDNTIIQQGYFDATGNDIVIPLRNSANWVEVFNYTQWVNAAGANAHYFYWQVGNTQGDAFLLYHAAATTVVNSSTCATLGSRGIYTYDQSDQTLGAPVAVTNVTAAAPPLVLTGATAGVIANQSIIRLVNIVGGQQMSGMDFSAGAIVANVSIALAHMPQPIAATTGFYRIVNYNPLYYPRRRYVTAITAAANAVVVTSVTHDFNVGEKVRFIVPAAFGMTQMDGLTGTVVARNILGTTGNNTLTVNIDSTGFTAFAFPVTGAVPFTYAEVVPVGEDTASALAFGTNILAGATENRGTTGIILATDNVTAATALLSAGGTAGDHIKWKAGTSFSQQVLPI